jgi:hypothetical protein
MQIQEYTDVADLFTRIHYNEFNDLSNGISAPYGTYNSANATFTIDSVNGRMRYQSTANNALALVLINSHTMSDGIYKTSVEADASTISATISFCIGSDSLSGYILTFTFAGSQAVALSRMDSGSTTEIATSTETITTNTLYNIKLILDNGSIKIEIDDVEVISTTDSNYTGGKFLVTYVDVNDNGNNAYVGTMQYYAPVYRGADL